MTRAGARGFTLLELLLALSIVATMLVILFAGVGVGFKAWRQGEARAEGLQRERGLAQLLARPLAAAFPYLGPADRGGARVIRFEGEPDRLSFVTAAPPVPLSPAIAFTAVTLAMERQGAPGLAIREKALPNLDPFGPARPAVVDPAVTGLRFRYLREPGAPWQERWDAAQERGLPRAVEITVTTAETGQLRPQPPIVVTIRATTP
ncbi:MAG TPA: type II secretion system protein GspJ [Methylomirabilota bacterium]|nr:type II secretion system protein GspJ [Methylomirabilota bacterium]